MVQVVFLAAYDWIVENNSLDRDEKEFLKNKTFYGNEIVANTRRMCLMNMYLHNIGEIDGDTPIKSADALVSDDGLRVDYVWQTLHLVKKVVLQLLMKMVKPKNRNEL